MNITKETNDVDERVYVDVLKKSTNYDNYASYFGKYGENIINKANDYYIAIDRFSVPCTNIPVLIFNPTTNFYTVEMEYSGTFSGSVSLTYIPSNANITVNNSEYYYVYEYELMIYMLNQAIQTAFTTLGGLIALPGGSTAPYFQVDPNTKVVQYCAESANYDSFNLPNPIRLYVNDEIYNLMYGMHVYYDYLSTNRRALMLAYNTGNNLSTSGIFTMSSNRGVSTLTNWNICKGLLMTSDYIPTVQETLPFATRSDLLNKMNILSNFDFVYDTEHPIPDNAQFILRSVYKLISLKGIQPLNMIDIKLYWYDIYNNTYSITMQPNQAFSIRLVFIKKK